jgi:hypothetical protein
MPLCSHCPEPVATFSGAGSCRWFPRSRITLPDTSSYLPYKGRHLRPVAPIGCSFPSAITRFEETETRLGRAARRGERACPEAALLAFVYVVSLTMASVLIAVLGR